MPLTKNAAQFRGAGSNYLQKFPLPLVPLSPMDPTDPVFPPQDEIKDEREEFRGGEDENFSNERHENDGSEDETVSDDREENVCEEIGVGGDDVGNEIGVDACEEEDNEEEEEDENGTGVMAPEMHLPSTEWTKPIRIITRCYVAKAVETIETVLDVFEKQWFYDHPQFRHFFHMPKDANHKTMGMWLMIARMARIKKRKELWFVVNGVPIRYSMREHALISGLHCHEYPECYNNKRIGRLSFVKKHFKNRRITQELVEKKFLAMQEPTRDRLKMAILYFLTAVIKGSGKRGEHATRVDTFLTRIVADLDACWDFPWGRYTFFDNLSEIKRMVNLFDGSANKTANLPGFIIPLELLPFEAIPCLMKKFRVLVKDATSGCPKMCKSKFTHSCMKGYSFQEINKALGETKRIDSIVEPKWEERSLIRDIPEDIDDEDAAVDGWCRRVLVDNKRVCLGGMYKEDIEVRKKARVLAEASGCQKTSTILKEMTAVMESGFNQLSAKLQSIDQRLTLVEDSFKELKDPSAAANVQTRPETSSQEKPKTKTRTRKQAESMKPLTGCRRLRPRTVGNVVATVDKEAVKEPSAAVDVAEPSAAVDVAEPSAAVD